MNCELPAPCIRVLDGAEQLGLQIEIKTMPTSTRTAQEAAQAIGCDVSQIIKSLVFHGSDTGKAILLMVAGNNRVNEKSVTGHIGETIIRPDAKFARDATGFSIGGIPPFGHATHLDTYMDRDLLHHKIVYAAGGMPNTIFAIDPSRLAGISYIQLIDIKG